MTFSLSVSKRTKAEARDLVDESNLPDGLQNFVHECLDEIPGAAVVNVSVSGSHGPSGASFSGSVTVEPAAEVNATS